MKVLKVFDCSNSYFRSSHRPISKGPKDNDILADLKKYQDKLNLKFVPSIDDADVIITNDVFTPKAVSSIKPLIKRMDGTYWQNSFLERNATYNHSVAMADAIIYISEFSKESLHKLYPKIIPNKEFVVLNQCDDSIFNRFGNYNDGKFIFSAACTNWERTEKRYNAIVSLADYIEEDIYLIGAIPFSYEIPDNIKSFGYMTDYKKISNILNRTDAFINLSYMDAAPKCVCQAVACGLPVLYANSGGVKEIVGENGIPIVDKKEIEFGDKPESLSLINMYSAYRKMKTHHKSLVKKMKDTKKDYVNDCLQKYADILQSTYEEYYKHRSRLIF